MTQPLPESLICTLDDITAYFDLIFNGGMALGFILGFLVFLIFDFLGCRLSDYLEPILDKR